MCFSNLYNFDMRLSIPSYMALQVSQSFTLRGSGSSLANTSSNGGQAILGQMPKHVIGYLLLGC